MTTRTWTETQVRALGVRTDLETACSVLGIGRTVGFDLARRGDFPTPVIKVSTRWVVPVAPLLRLLELADNAPDTQQAPPAEGDAAAQILDLAKKQETHSHGAIGRPA